LVTFISLVVISVLIVGVLYYGMVSAQGPGDYDPWYDVNDDGTIDMRDIGGMARKFGTSGTPINKTELLLDLNASVTQLEAKLNAEVGSIFIPMMTNGTVCSTRDGGCVLKWEAQNFDFLLDNTSGDWLDFWLINKGTYVQGALMDGTTEYKLIDWNNNNDDGAEIHFGQADGTGGYCSVWIQYANGRIVGHYIKY
jgi:hypothetical protein